MKKLTVKIEIMQGRKWVKRATLRTIHKKPKDDNMSDDTFARLLIAGHSTIRQFRIWVDFDSLEERVHTHLVRHRGADFYVGSFREDWLKELNLDPSEFKDENGVWLRNMSFAVNVEVLIHMAKQRLCGRAWSGTQVAMNLIVEELSTLDATLSSYLLRPCVWFGFCPETNKCCGYTNTEKFRDERKWLTIEADKLSNTDVV